MAQPLALVVEDDPTQAMALSYALKKWGLRAEVVPTAKEFISKFKELKPQLCFIDLNIDTLGAGFTIIQAVRNILGSEPILIVVSGESDRNAIAHAIEVGANDFIIKPIDKEILASKILPYVQTKELADAPNALLPVPDGGSAAVLSLDLEIEEIDEFGARLRGRHLLSKGVSFYFSSKIFEEILGSNQPLLMTVISTWIEDDSKSYGATIEFDQSNNELVTKVRRWLAIQREPKA